MNHAKMIRAYFQQTEQYYSANKDAMVSIKDMPARHAMNAARRLATDASMWYGDAGAFAERGNMYSATDAWAWVISSPLYRALCEQAGIPA